LSTPQGSHINELFCLGGVQMVLILVGRPGSGKSMFAQSVLNNDRNGETWEVACQDDLGTRQKCEHLVNETLLEKKNIIIDRTNISIEQRATWIQSGFQQDLCNIVVAVFGEDMDKRELISNVTTRTEHPTLNSQNAKYVIDQMTNNYATPTLSEGIDLIFHVPSKLNEREMFSTELQKWSESRNGSGTKYESGGDTSVSSTSSSSSTSSKSSAANSATKSTTTTSTSSTSSFSSSSSISTKEPKQDMPLPSSYPPTFAFVPMEIKAGTQDHPSATSTEHINTILTTATTFLNEHTTFNVELILNTLNDTEHENMYTLLTKDPTTSSLLSTLATFKTTNSEDRFRILNNINMSEYPLLLNSKASIVSTPAVMKFMPGGTDLNKNVHRMYAVAHGCGKSSTQALSVETLNRHKHFKKNESYVVDVPIQLIATGKLQRSSNRTTVTQIIHTMQTNNPLEAYTNMFGTMQRNYESPDYTPPPSTSGSSSLSFSSSFTSNDPSRTSSSSLIANSKCFTLKAIPRSYTPPEGKPVRSGNWSKVLNDYLSSTLTDRQASQIFMQTSRFVVLYDGYPKSTLHLLFIPRPVYLNKLYPDNCQAYDLRKLKLLHLAAKEIQQHMEQWWCGGGSGSVVPEGTGINVGYHEKPSLERMHIHLISNNFESVNMKTKKHRDSFQTDFFVDIDKFIGMVAERV
jgi:aprataxin